MDLHTATRRRMAIVVAALTGAAGLFVALPASAQSNDGTVVPGNPGCADLTGGAGWTELKVEPPASGTFTDGTLTVDVVVSDSPAGQVFSWDSNIGVDAVIVKGGPNASVYVYDPEATSDSGLHAPANESGSWAGLSHISFCYDEDDVPPPTTPSTPTTSPTTQPRPPTPPAAQPAPAARPVTAQPTFTG
jgi:hypothetical protein